VPTRFADWQLDQHALSTAIGPAATEQPAGAYAQTLERVYVDSQHRYVMLSMAYSSRELGDSLQAHRPEYCYKAQGFTVDAIGDGELTTPRGRLPIRRLHANRPGRSEPVSYWLTVGDLPALPGLSRKLAQLRQGLFGKVPDSMLVRVSSIEDPTPEAYALHDRFLTDLLAAVPKAGWTRLAGQAVHP
jgi:EpsI family protein